MVLRGAHAGRLHRGFDSSLPLQSSSAEGMNQCLVDFGNDEDVSSNVFLNELEYISTNILNLLENHASLPIR